jgi:site-specific DNA recombinase
MIHTYTARGSKRYRYYVCYSAQQRGWKSCETKSISAPAIESAVLDSIRRLGRDTKLAEAVAAEAVEQLGRRRGELERESAEQSRHLRHLNHNLAREAGDTRLDSGARFERMAEIQREIEGIERRLTEITAERKDLEGDHINAHELRCTLAEFDAVWGELTAKEQEQLIQLLVAKVGYDGRTGKVRVNFRSAGAKELCQGK